MSAKAIPAEVPPIEHWSFNRNDKSSDPADWRKWAESGRGVGFDPEELIEFLNKYDALADALAEYIEEVERDGWPSVEWSNANLERMRAALRAAGRLP